MRKIDGSCCFVFNKALSLQREGYEAGDKFINYVEMAKLLTQWRNSTETPWLKNAPCPPLQHSLKDADRSYKNFFAKRAGFPRFKKRSSGSSFRYPDPKQFKLEETNNRVFLPKLGWMKYRNSRKVVGEVRNITVSTNGDKWFMSVQTQLEVKQPVTQTTSVIGIDVGIARFATMNDGSYIEPLHSFKKYKLHLAKHQRRKESPSFTEGRMSKTQIGSTRNVETMITAKGAIAHTNSRT